MDAKKVPQKKQMKIVKKPYVTGSPVDQHTAKEAAKTFLAMLVMMLAFLLLSSMLLWDNLFLRILTNGVVLLGAWGLFYANGMSKGATAVNSGEILYQRQQEGKPINAADLRASYHPAKGFITALLGSIPCFLCALVLALIGKQQMYGLSSLPTWLQSYTSRSEVGDALAYYAVTQAMAVEDVLRVIVRMMIMPVVSMVGTENAANLLLVERLAPLLVLMPSVCYGVGYTQGVRARTQVHSSIAAADRKYKRKEKKKQQQRRVRQPEQLN